MKQFHYIYLDTDTLCLVSQHPGCPLKYLKTRNFQPTPMCGALVFFCGRSRPLESNHVRAPIHVLRGPKISTNHCCHFPTPDSAQSFSAIYKFICRGGRLAKPTPNERWAHETPQEIYDIMCQCWNEDRSERPNFNNLHASLVALNSRWYRYREPIWSRHGAVVESDYLLLKEYGCDGSHIYNWSLRVEKSIFITK